MDNLLTGNMIKLKPINIVTHLSQCSYTHRKWIVVSYRLDISLKHRIAIIYMTGFWKTDRIVPLGLFHFIGPANGLSQYKWSGETIYDSIDGPGDHLCRHNWSGRTTYA